MREVLGAKYDMGLFKDLYVRIGKAETDLKEYYGEDRLHRDAARDVARRSLVLLENRTQTLPLKKAGTIALVGPLADAPIDMTDWSFDDNNATPGAFDLGASATTPSSPPRALGTQNLPRAGELLAGKYLVDRVLGAGGMGVVVAARHTQLDQRVALTEMPVETAFRDVQALGQHLDADTRHPLVGEGVEGGLNPCGAIELGAG